VNVDEVESQLSAMFDGELPAAECELLSRRIDREESLRGRWSRYALIGAAMRSEPVATARSGFAKRVKAALEPATGNTARARLRRGVLWSAALAASLVATVAALSINMLRDSTVSSGIANVAQIGAAARGPGQLETVVAHAAAEPVAAPAPLVAVMRSSGREPLSYVTPAAVTGAGTVFGTQLADYIVAHSEYSTPLMRRDLLSALVSSGDAADGALPAAGAAGSAAVDKVDATTAASFPGR